MSALGLEFITPREIGVLDSTPTGKFPFRFGREPFARPFGERGRVAVRHMHDGMFHELRDAAVRPVRMPPVGAEPEFPPLAPVAKIDCMVRWREYQRTGMTEFGKRARIVVGIGRDL